MYILSCPLSTYLKELRKAAENKISSWNCMGCVLSDVNDKLKGILKECVSSVLWCSLSICVKELRKATNDNQAENKSLRCECKAQGLTFQSQINYLLQGIENFFFYPNW
jgi:hypothetical protein